MEKIILGKELYQMWDSFAKQSDDTWFWHTTDYMEYIIEYSSDKFVENQSFLIKDNNEIVAICPAIIGKSFFGEKDGYEFCYAYDPLPAIAMKNGLKQLAKKKIIEFYLEELKKNAIAKNINYASIRIPSLATSFLSARLPLANPFVKYGFIDLPYQTQIIDLRNSLDDIWGDMTKGHKANIKRAQKLMKINIWNYKNITLEKFRDYQYIHQKNARKVRRSQKTFDLMYGWLMTGNAILAEGVLEDKPVVFSLIIIYKNGAFYASSCKDLSSYDLPSTHLLQWELIKYLKDNNVIFYELGMQNYGPQWFCPNNGKEVSISKFKRGFGGMAVPTITSEYFYSNNLMKDTFLKRLKLIGY